MSTGIVATLGVSQTFTYVSSADAKLSLAVAGVISAGILSINGTKSFVSSANTTSIGVIYVAAGSSTLFTTDSGVTATISAYEG